ncbi:hypothetical protein B9Q03_06265 [Candidatus Marsarchaeota G2 archaeon OSP_D]|jgi:hypothetical protein|uniref:Uncharacterized protein n=3 Tax=Candidatus Marsarchaeota group 2 TaxID=2203771 RepID=A0A2R6CCB4_9ARCH|nr:MAG: hypothetical protein B9Q08_06205 [Candidatus Marsarchaeota G2 archaeon ECH_B_SAG-M15]PSN90697.1 MAG: hypothetical protein B9Q03_06265 [Candidatus Marsarchaeota G2 archaeon OSP_D]PSO08542.1 MAG: hypothetical protein B9Q04_05060 [Candidatus Marsarchaeota G2 archaeon BE_D]
MPVGVCFKGVRTLVASYLLSDTSLEAGYVSAAKLRKNYLQRKRVKLGRVHEFNQVLEGLVLHGVLNAKREGNTLYTLNPDRPDFLTLYLGKKVRVSPGYHRSMTLRARLLALRGGIGEYATGTVSWVPWQYKPMVIMHEPKRIGLTSGGGGVRWERSGFENGGVLLNLVFDPPLHMGEILEYGFYTWTREHYARSRADALKRFGDEWVREGLEVRNEAEFVELVVTPHRDYQSARVEADTQERFTPPTGNMKIIRSFQTGQEKLVWSYHRPERGRYFIAWVPPEQ